MLRKARVIQMGRACGRKVAAGALVAFSVSMAGCSADLGRFSFSKPSDPDVAPQATASLPQPSEPLRRNAGIPVDTETGYRDNGSGRPAPYGGVAPPQSPSREPPVRLSGLPEPTVREPAAKSPPAVRPAAAPAGGRQVPTATAVAPAATAAAPAAPAAAGQVIEVQQGDTLYAISKRHRVAISELMAVNNLQNPNIRPGQKIALPGGKRAVAQRPAGSAPLAATPAAAPATPVVAAQPAPVRAATPAPTNWGGSYTVVQGDNLFAIAKKHSVKPADLQSANAIADPAKVRPGTVLKVPGTGGAAPAVATAPARTAPAAEPVASASASGPRPTILNAPAAAPAEGTKVAALGTAAATSSDASPAAAKPDAAALADPPKLGTSGKFRWPAKGKVIASFGPRADSTHNDGINISVPQGTEVVAAENGVVAYAGSELKGYGNLILVRHDGNWVSAYAHNEALLVKRGDKIKRGQAIAKAGNTGTVDQPQVHFELRQGSKPVDPIPHMEKN